MPDTAVSAIIDHWFWLCLVAAVIIWYSTITIYVAIKGAFDIRNMFTRLRGQSEMQSEDTVLDTNSKSPDKQ